MNSGDFLTMMLNLPRIVAWGGAKNQKEKLIKLMSEIAANRIAAAYDFDFVMDEAEETAVVDTQTYTLKGNSSDCRDVINVRYGDNSLLLNKWTSTEVDDFLSNTTTRSGSTTSTVSPTYFFVSGIENGFPRITIGGTIAAGQTIKYRYRRKNITIHEFPDEFLDVLQEETLSGIFPGDFGLRGAAERSLGQMIDDYNKRGGQDQRPPMSASWRAKNRRRNWLHGF